MQRALPLLALVVLITPGCLSAIDPSNSAAGDIAGAIDGVTDVRERADMAFDNTGKWSATLAEGAFAILDGVSVDIAVDVPLGNGAPSQTVNMGLFFPDIEGCDWSAANLPDECRLPVVADIGPYYGEALFDPPATERAGRLGGFLIENLVPHGYIIAQVSVFGTGDSTGCMDLLGPVEQLGVQAAVDHLGKAPFSNGNVGLIGRSYDGSTPWEAAMVPSEHLKTIVPISGLLGVRELMWRNGSAEDRGPAQLWAIYWTFTHSQHPDNVDPALQGQQALENALCPDTATSPVHGHGAYLTGDDFAADVNDYWTSRRFQDAALENYEGSVYYIHGMQDWNVDPHMAFPFYQDLQAKGLDVKGLFGQWQHMYPDRPSEHDSCDFCPSETTVRWDWAQDLLEWFNYYLKGTGEKPALHVEMQDDRGAWRLEDTFPPADMRFEPFALGTDLKQISDGPAIVAPATAADDPVTGSEQRVVFRSAPLTSGLRIAGLPQFHVTVTPAGEGGQLYAELRDATDDRRIGHAIMDLRYAAGGDEMQPVTPGEPIVAKMELFALDTFVAAGHELELWVSSTGRDYMPAATSAPVIIDVSDASVLRLPVIDRDASAFFAPPGVPAVMPDA